MMAFDWIKMRSNIDHDWRVLRMAEILGLPELHIVGCLWKVWSWADQNTVDGNAICVTDVTLERYTGVTGFAYAMREVGWLKGENGALCLPNFTEHNGQTAKKRAQTQVRVAKHRNAESVTKALPEKRREEKIRDKKKTPLPPLDVPAELQDICQDWLTYKKEKRKTYTPTGLRELFAEVRQVAASAGVEEVKRRFQRAMASNYQGWNFESQGGNGKPASKPVTFAQQAQANMAAIISKAAAADAAAGRITGQQALLEGYSE
jgi:hypothetical protein